MGNAIIERRNGGSGDGGAGMSVADLEAYAAKLNRMNFTIAQGIHWFVNKRESPDGEIQRFLDNRKVFDGDNDAARPIHKAAKALESPREPPFGQWHPGHAD